MTRYSRRFVISSLLCLLLSAVMGLGMAIFPSIRGAVRFSHIHLMLIGWLSFMVFGLAYHVIPRFSGTPLIKEKWPARHWWVANIALFGMIIIPILKFVVPQLYPVWISLFAIFGLLQFSGIVIFVTQMLISVRFIPCKDTLHTFTQTPYQPRKTPVQIKPVKL